jgi:hypothetical protein
MSERDIYDLDRVGVDPFDPVGTSSELVDRARRAADLGCITRSPMTIKSW